VSEDIAEKRFFSAKKNKQTRGMTRVCLRSHGNLSVHFRGSVSNVEMETPMGLIYKALFPSISTFETPPIFGKVDLREAPMHYRVIPPHNVKKSPATESEKLQLLGKALCRTVLDSSKFLV